MRWSLTMMSGDGRNSFLPQQCPSHPSCPYGETRMMSSGGDREIAADGHAGNRETMMMSSAGWEWVAATESGTEKGRLEENGHGDIHAEIQVNLPEL
ncbi:hypothetical protein E2320_021326 [Naja naja]|nr:hypothetical protein E2320_021326 [Naja naja]